MTKPGAQIIHTEFQSRDADATRDFLTAMFEVESTEHTTPVGVLHDFAIGEGVSIAVRNTTSDEAEPGTMSYFETDDLDATLKKAEAAGAKVVVPKMTFAGKGYIAWVQGPAGLRLAFLQRDSSVDTIGVSEGSPAQSDSPEQSDSPAQSDSPEQGESE